MIKRKRIRDEQSLLNEDQSRLAVRRLKEKPVPTESAFGSVGGDAFRCGASSRLTTDSGEPEGVSPGDPFNSLSLEDLLSGAAGSGATRLNYYPGCISNIAACMQLQPCMCAAWRVMPHGGVVQPCSVLL
jgi:hypothetical protein